MNKIKKAIFPILLMIFFNAGINAQTQKSDSLPPEVMAWTKSTLDPWSYKYYKSLKEAMIDNDFYIPTVFRGGIFPKFDFGDDFGLPKPNIPPAYSLDDKYIKNMFSSYLIRKSLEDGAYKEMTKNPFNFKYTTNQFPGNQIKPENIEKTFHEVKVAVSTANVSPEPVGSELKFIPNRKYWTSSFFVELKFSQTKTSDNWFNGKADNMNIYENIVIDYNYAKGKVSLTNKLSITLKVDNAPKDTVHSYAISQNDLRFRSNFGVQAIKNWSYSASFDFYSPLLHKFKVNLNNLNSTFLSPFTMGIGIGMTFSKNYVYKRPNHNWNIVLSIEPLAFTYTYSKNKDIELGAYFPKNKDGEIPHINKSFGPHVNLTSTYNFNKYIRLETRAKYSTNYERAIFEFDNKLYITLNRFFSTQFFFYPRYDDGVAKSPESDTYWQTYEFFSFGFQYKW
jgi:hypothetical protein